jgi:uncharacterized repeat protein (TIGR01451 family)
MKHIILPFLLVFIIQSATAQIINIPDSNFKQKILQAGADINGDGNIQLAEALQVQLLSVENSNIHDLTGIEAFTNLRYLNCNGNPITNIHFSTLTALEYLYCRNTLLTAINGSDIATVSSLICMDNPLLTSIDLHGIPAMTWCDCSANPQLKKMDVRNCTGLVTLFSGGNILDTLLLSGCSNLSDIYCDYTSLDTIDLHGLTKLNTLYISHNPLRSIDVSDCPGLRDLFCGFDSSLVYLNLKNGYPGNFTAGIFQNPNLKYICADEEDVLAYVNYLPGQSMPNVNVNSYCTFTPGGTYNTIKGKLMFDYNSNGCDNLDMAMADTKMKLSGNGQDYYNYTNTAGDYTLYTQAGNYTVAPQLQNPFFTVMPVSATVSFAASNGSLQLQDFCITKNGIHNDAEIVLIPADFVYAGMNTGYQIVIKNKGTETLSGTITLSFDDYRLDYLQSTPAVTSQTTGLIGWNYVNLQPFETRIININFDILAAPINYNGNILSFSATINPVAGDETPRDNVFDLQQTIDGPGAPTNNINCLEGANLLLADIGDYIHYKISFQNTGTDSVKHVVLKDLLDAKLNWNSLEITNASHPVMVRQSNGNTIEFIFENAKLPTKLQNPQTSKGFIAFKIRSNTNLAAGDSILSKGEVYFDARPPFNTNTAKVKFVNNNIPVVNLGNDISICGATATLNAGNAGSTFLWSTGASAQSISVNSTGTYWVKVTNQYGFSASDTIQVTLIPLPSVNLGADIIQCGGSVTLNAANPGSSYLWSNGAATQSIGVATSGIYSVKVTNSNGCSKSDTIQVTINPLPTVTLGADIAQCGGIVTLNAANAGSIYLWNNGAVTQNISVSASGSYSVKVTSSNGCSKSDTINITINALPVATLGRDTSICAGSSVLLDAGNAGATYLWNTGSTARTINVNQGGIYSVSVTNSAGCRDGDTIQLTQRSAPAVQFALPDTIYANDGDLQLTASPAGGRFSGTAVVNGLFNPAAAGMGNHIIRYSYTDVFGCSNTTTASIFVNAPATTVNVFPNPNRGDFYVAMARNLRNTALTIVTPSGQVVGRYTLNGLLQNIRLTLQPGLYYLKFSNTGLAETRRMMVW